SHPGPLEKSLQILLQGQGTRLAGTGGEQVDIGARGLEQCLARHAPQLSLLLEDLPLSIDLLKDGVAEVEPAVDVEPAEQRAEAGARQCSVRIGDAAFMPGVRRADVEARQPGLVGHVLGGEGFLDARSSQSDLTALSLGKTQYGIKIDRQRLG